MLRGAFPTVFPKGRGVPAGRPSEPVLYDLFGSDAEVGQERSLPMMRPLALVFAAMLVAGCRAPNGSMDPFLGRQTVPPPGTGVASSPPGNAYYQAPRSSTVTPGPAPAGDGRFVPSDGAYNYGGSAAARPATTPAAAQPARLGNTASNATASRLNAGGAPVRSLTPADRAPTNPGSRLQNASPPGSFQVNNNPGLPATTASRRLGTTPPSSMPRPIDNAPATDINDLPRRSSRSGSSSDPASSSGSTNGFRPAGSTSKRVSYERQSDESDEEGNQMTLRTPRRETLTRASSTGDYSHAPDYQWVKGRLEYSRIDDRWKLRYIPINGDTDEYGGSVVLLGSRMMEGYKPGELVTAYGTVDASESAESRGFAPPYRLDRIVRQSEERR
jgi:hypothetical protein